jgi:N-glycosylase/DNA lyase
MQHSEKLFQMKVGAITTILLLISSQGFSCNVVFSMKLVFQAVLPLTCTFQAEVQVMLPCAMRSVNKAARQNFRLTPVMRWHM